ncbi:hypothetical protein [Bdellovibrio reynosensis]|uniref:Response regulatory domain-containing protein n=1 Tax=Bdellovibrio reynosensis TaxID=2835041 RepID=A0ABY4CD30_9BACT|nr:hypothetical protein [Bdellovibrio reynosensis]UOF02689.1 hypothetical protein MNR06_06970 [Bdellovibrio reynosensis]
MKQDNANKTLLIIKGSANSLATVESFLRNREWKVKSTTNLKEALIHLVQQQPKFVMVSVDHPNKKVRNLPKILTAAFPVCVIAFAEESSTASYNMLSNAATEYLLYPPVTGPAVERTVNKYYKDLQTKDPAQMMARAGLKQNEEEGVIAIRGGADQQFNSQNAQSLLAQMLGGEDGASFVNSTGSQNSPQGMVPGSPQQNANGPQGMVPGSSNNNVNGPQGMIPGAQQGNPQFAGGAPLTGPGFNGNQPQGMAAGNGFNGMQPGTGMPPGMPGRFGNSTNSDSEHMPRGMGGSALHSRNFDPDDDKPYTSSIHNLNRGDGPGWAPLPVKPKAKKHRAGPEQIEEDPRATKGGDSVMLRGTKDALDKSCNITGTFAQSEAIESSTNVACIVVESPKFSGYLVAALGNNRAIDSAFIQRINEKLIKFLKDNGEKIDEGESMQLRIKQVPFEDWALDCAEFLRKSVHDGNEVAMAFFPRQDVRTSYGESAAEEMASIKTKDLAAGVPVEFNVYIHLPRNNKYVLYTPRGAIFYDVQKQRLDNQGIQELHILKHELQDLDKYRAQNFLNDKIQEFEAKENKKKLA